MESITTYNYVGNKVLINGHENASAPATILGCLVIDGLIVLLLDPDKLNSNSNIYCYNVTGKLEWIIESFDECNHQYFTSIYVLKDLKLYAYNINGVEAKIDFQTGKILSTELIK
jgi:hypothetical protein